jgi:hypothetical protein
MFQSIFLPFVYLFIQLPHSQLWAYVTAPFLVPHSITCYIQYGPHLSGFQSSFVASSESTFHCHTSGTEVSWSYRILIAYFSLFCVSKFFLSFHAYTGIFKVSYFYLDRLCGLVVRVPGYRSWGPWFDSRCYHIFWEIVGRKQGPLSLVKITEELLKWKSSDCGQENRN